MLPPTSHLFFFVAPPPRPPFSIKSPLPNTRQRKMEDGSFSFSSRWNAPLVATFLLSSHQSPLVCLIVYSCGSPFSSPPFFSYHLTFRYIAQVLFHSSAFSSPFDDEEDFFISEFFFKHGLLDVEVVFLVHAASSLVCKRALPSLSKPSFPISGELSPFTKRPSFLPLFSNTAS